MAFRRLPRFKRAAQVEPIQLTERDREIIRLVHRHRLLRSSHIVSLVPGSAQQLLRRLQLLYHHGYLERPRAQIDYYQNGGSHHIVYGLGNKGWTWLKREPGTRFLDLRGAGQNRAIGRMFLAHELLVSDVMVAIELSCRRNGIRLLTERELVRASGATGRHQPFRWRVKVNGRLQLSVIPDRVFALEFKGRDGEDNRALFFLEADRGTMPIIRKNLFQTSFYRKLLAYEATWSQSIHRSRFDFNRFRVLTVTTNAERVRSLVDACSKLKRGHGLFLFADRTILGKTSDLFSPIWQSARQGERMSLLGSQTY